MFTKTWNLSYWNLFECVIHWNDQSRSWESWEIWNNVKSQYFRKKTLVKREFYFFLSKVEIMKQEWSPRCGNSSFVKCNNNMEKGPSVALHSFLKIEIEALNKPAFQNLSREKVLDYTSMTKLAFDTFSCCCTKTLPYRIKCEYMA